jgi:hypothetical protein
MSDIWVECSIKCAAIVDVKRKTVNNIFLLITYPRLEEKILMKFIVKFVLS